MINRQLQNGYNELREARRTNRALYWAVGLFSVFANLLMLTGPIYMLQIYDRVLGSRSIETLIGLSVIGTFLFVVMGVLDVTRNRVMTRAAARFQARLDRRVFDAVIRRSAIKHDEVAQTGMRDLESVQKLMSSPVLMAGFDIPWTPILLAGIALFHPWLGMLAIGGGVMLVIITVINQMMSKAPQNSAMYAMLQSEKLSEHIRNESEMVTAMGMRQAAFYRWSKLRGRALSTQIASTDMVGGFSSVTKTFRLFLQSAMLGLGALLALRGEITPGAMIAGSILMGRALAPIELAIGQWPVVQRAVRGWHSLAILLGETPPEAERTALPKPRAKLDVIQLTVVPPGEAVASLRMLSFTVEPGQAVGVIGPSGAGKSTLARALTGVWRPAGGKVRLDGAALDNYDPTVLGRYIGYLPQRVQLFEGTIAENIARLEEKPDADAIVEAAKKADAHDMILKMPDGYDTRIDATGGRLSGGQIQRIGLARALYGDPVILVLDEPNSNLDNEGSAALNKAIRNMKAEGKSALIMAHRPAAIQECDTILMLDGGGRVAFGPRDEVLAQVVQNHEQIRAGGSGGLR
ncbi:protease/lipase ABC transporter permease/ATP-binding protein [Primorskyibacter flagellatus]|uniref:Protease/lipase ABC transporter permease/ATP-binding protein n=1 Tax=Primorskyibacter flagellatus TaxID=1387277 RepID=A0A917AC59_9RHOB|nr:type I secretion system permease/ATPase [Primorskyibacter flagellatus]GGE42636.1 protease/lipase ABC transporter permease/ATP-binding protein [Primorskyibacter flagellatus]